MTDEPGFDKAIATVYDAAADPGLWPGALAAVIDVLGANGAQVLIWDNRADTAAFSSLVGFSDEANRGYCEHYGAIDPKWSCYGSLSADEIFLCHRHFDQGFVNRSEFFQDFLIPAGGRWCMVGNLLHTTDLAAVIGVHRNARMEHFGDRAEGLLTRLVPHLQRTVQLQQRLGRIEAERQALAGTLDRLPFGIILVDARMRAVPVNQAAEDLLRRNDGIGIRQGRVVAARAAETAALRRLVEGAARTARGLGQEAGGMLALPRPSGRRPLSVLVAPLRPGASSLLPDIAAPGSLVALFVTDPEREVRTPTALLRQGYGLTAREAELAVMLAAGISLQEAADRLGVTHETARTYLKRIFSKTGTARQSELTTLLLRSVGGGPW